MGLQESFLRESDLILMPLSSFLPGAAGLIKNPDGRMHHAAVQQNLRNQAEYKKLYRSTEISKVSRNRRKSQNNTRILILENVQASQSNSIKHANICLGDFTALPLASLSSSSSHLALFQ